MSELASVEELRKWLHADAYEHPELMAIVDEIEREVSERFMELPVDADGVPIHVGDVLTTLNGYKKRVDGIFTDGFAVHKEFTDYDKCYSADFIHVNPRTIEDVLYEFGCKYNYRYPNTGNLVEETAAELRGMMEADE